MKKNKVFNNQSGVALLMTISTITILTLLMYAFKFETSINKVKTYNTTARSQARINAESGLHLALVRLEIFQKAMNALAANKQLSQFASPDILNQIWELPLIFPLPITGDTSLRQKKSIKEFEENLFLDGNISTTIQNYSFKLNLNSLRNSEILKFLALSKSKTNNNTTPLPGSDSTQETSQEEEKEKDTIVEIEKRFIELLRNALEAKKESDTYFYNKYSGIDLEELMAQIKYYISDKGADIGAYANQVASDFDKAAITPKYAPFSSITELYMLPGWNDELVSLIKNEITVHGDMIIDVNKMTSNLLKLVVPDITDEQIKSFFEYKNNPNVPIIFESEKDLIKYFADDARIIEKNALESRFELMKKAGISFGAKPTLFKIISNGKYNNTNYNIEAIVVIPRVEKKEEQTSQVSPPTTRPTSESSTENKEEKYEYAKPKVIEILIN